LSYNPFDDPGLFGQLKSHVNEYVLMKHDNMQISVITTISGGSNGHPSSVFRVMDLNTKISVDRFSLRSAIARATTEWRKK